MDFLEDLEMYDQAMNNAYDIITKKKTVDDIYLDLEDEDYDKYPYLEASWTVRYNRTMLPNQWNVSCNRHSPNYNKGHHSQIPILRLIRRPGSHQYNSHHPLLYFHLQTTFPESWQTAHQT